MKLATEGSRWWLAPAAFVWGAVVFGWYHVLTFEKLSVTGALYGVLVVVMLTALSIIYFKEKLTFTESIGIVLACVSIFLLKRF